MIEIVIKNEFEVEFEVELCEIVLKEMILICRSEKQTGSLCESVSIQQQECVGIIETFGFKKLTVLLNDRQTSFGED